MSIREIPKSFEYECDVCGETHRQENASGHYTDSRPPHWARLILRQDATDYQGKAVADGSVDRLLCSKCRDSIASAIIEATHTIRKEKKA